MAMPAPAEINPTEGGTATDPVYGTNGIFLNQEEATKYALAHPRLISEGNGLTAYWDSVAQEYKTADLAIAGLRLKLIETIADNFVNDAAVAQWIKDVATEMHNTSTSSYEIVLSVQTAT